MTKQPKLGKDPLAWVDSSKHSKPVKQSKLIITKTSQANLKEGWTRATIIIKEADLNKIKDIAYTDRKKITTVFNEAIELYLKTRKGKTLKRKER